MDHDQFASTTELAYSRRSNLSVDVALPKAPRPSDCWPSREHGERAVAEANRLLNEQVQEAVAARGAAAP